MFISSSVVSPFSNENAINSGAEKPVKLNIFGILSMKVYLIPYLDFYG